MDEAFTGVDSIPDLDFTSTSSGLGTDDFRSSSSSGDISVTSTSSGEIPAVLVAEVAMEPRSVEITTPMTVTEAARRKCVGRNNNRGGLQYWGLTSVIGRRKEMEDATTVHPGFISSRCDHVGGCTAPGSRSSGEISPVHFFAVYDGHGGSQVAKFCSERMHEVIAEEWGREGINDHEWQKRWEVAFSNGFQRTDNEIVSEAVATDMVGSTAVVVVLSGCQIITSNCGDSRAVLFQRNKAIPLTVDQKPDRQDELMRIEREGGKVINWMGARVLGVLAMSRAIGFNLSLPFSFSLPSCLCEEWYLNFDSLLIRTIRDIRVSTWMVFQISRLFHWDQYLRPWIIPVPEISFTTRSDEDECLVLASDGLWDVMTNEEVGQVACHLLRRLRRSSTTDNTTPAQIVANNLTEIAYGRNSCDNISVIVIDLKARKANPQRH